AQVREDVFTLYAFVRKADNFVDTVPQQKERFYAFVRTYREACSGAQTGDVIIDAFVDLMQRRQFSGAWVDAFLASMEMDLTVSRYQTMDDVLEYIYGSAEVIGLMMAKITGLHPESFPAAGMLGRAMQYINFIRDIREDLAFNRIYFPLDELQQHGLTSLDEDIARHNPEGFTRFIRTQIDHYCQWQAEAEQGFSYIPARYFIPIKTASEIYKWTAKQIYSNPSIVYQRKVKPLVPRIIGTVLYTVLDKRCKVMFCPR
ncbi:MAG: phytoene/squalene synthase family protein, partial [Thermoplasmatota archaeon]